MNYPKFDPHGDPIPDKNGKIEYRKSKIKLLEVPAQSRVEIVRVNEDSLDLLRFLERQGLLLGTVIDVLEKFPFDDSVRIQLEDKREINLSKKVTENIGVKFLTKLTVS